MKQGGFVIIDTSSTQTIVNYRHTHLLVAQELLAVLLMTTEGFVQRVLLQLHGVRSDDSLAASARKVKCRLTVV